MKTPKAITDTKNYYNQKTEFWVKHKTNSFHHELPFRKLITKWPTRGHIIDIGCAHASHVPLFLGIGRHLRYTGIDVSSKFLKVARSRYPQLPFLEANIADATTLPRKRFDGFMASAVLMHIPLDLWPTMFENIRKIVKPGSFGYITLPTVHPNAEPSPEDTRHFTLLSEEEQRAYLKQQKIKVVQSGTLDGFSQEGIWRWYIVKLS